MPARFSPAINRLRAALRGKHDSELLAALQREIEQLGVAALVADNSTRYIATNAPYRSRRRLWQDFIAHGVQRGEYELRRKDGTTLRVRYWAYASVAPGVHISLLVPTERVEAQGQG